MEDYKEKLRLAKEALDSGSYDKETIEYIFPELKENEDESWIPKEIIKYLKEKGDFRSCWIAWLEKQGEQNLANFTKTCKVEPKFRVKYAGNKYNVLEIKDIAGVTYYGIEDEPNHIDYVLPENCEIVSDYGYGVKEKGSPYPTKSAMFSEQHPAWSEEDENAIGMAIIALEDLYDEDSPDTTYGGYNLPFDKAAERLKSLKERYTWKPSDEQIEALWDSIPENVKEISEREILLDSLYQDLKKLRKE